MSLVFGQQDFSTANSIEAALEFLVEQMMARVNVCTPVKVIAVHSNGRSGVVGTVDVTPLVNQQTVLGESIPHTTVYGIPFIRVQGGSSALIVDPNVGDLGFCLFADSDISNVKATGEAGVPPTFRKFDMADGIYIGGWGIKQTPKQWVVIDESGVDIQAGSDGTLSEAAKEMSTTIQDTWNQFVAALKATYETCDITVPEFHIIGNLHVDGIVHCTWEGTNVAVGYGGTGADLSGTGGPNMVVAQLEPGAPFTVIDVSELSPGDQYSNANPTPSTIGGIPAGSTFVAQTMTQMWNRLLYPYQFPVFTGFSITGQASVLEVGNTSSANPTFTWSISNPSNISPNTISIKDTTASVTLVSGHSTTSPYAATYAGITKTVATQNVFTISGVDTNSDTFTDMFTIHWEWRGHWGNSADTALASADVLGLVSSALQTGFAGTYSFPAGASEYKILAYPSSFGTASTFKDTSTGFAVPFNAPYVVSVTNSFGVTTNYNVHQSSNMLGGAITIAVS